jgi:hypothetical protein
LSTVANLIQNGLNAIKLNILVFGPQVATLSADQRTLNLQKKRIQIREELEKLGHNVKYAEDMVDPNLPSPQNNTFLQEIVIMAEHDLIFNLVDSPGSITEAALIASKPNLCQKASLFLDSQYSTGLTAESCRHAKNLGADFNTYTYPKDLVDCNLLTFILERVSKAQLVKLIS